MTDVLPARAHVALMHVWIWQVPDVVEDGAACVRLGAVYALIVATYASQHEWEVALRMLQDMQARGVTADGDMSTELVQEIYSRNGLPAGGVVEQRGSGHHTSYRQDSPGDEIEEEVMSELEEEEEHPDGSGAGGGDSDGYHRGYDLGGRGSMRAGSYNAPEQRDRVVERMAMGEADGGVAEEDMYF